MLVGFIVFGAFLFFSGCSSETTTINNVETYPAHYVNFSAELHTYLHEYDQQAKKRGFHTTVHMSSIRLVDSLFNDPNKNVAGLCFKVDDSDNRYIEVKTRYWFNFSDIQRRALIYHEIGHCLLGKPHDETKLTIRGRLVPKLMASEIARSNLIGPYWETLVDGFFSSGGVSK